jgi:hypothetical protein
VELSGYHPHSVGIRFYAAPFYRLDEPRRPIPAGELIEPNLGSGGVALDRALSGAEFRDARVLDRLSELISPGQHASPFEPIAERCGRPAIFARPPHDLPALLRLADQLEALATEHRGERAMVWKCECGTRYAVPVTLFRAVTIRCDRCGRPVELSLDRSIGEESLLDPGEDSANRSRRELARFFRDAMARGWPVLVCSSD